MTDFRFSLPLLILGAGAVAAMLDSGGSRSGPRPFPPAAALLSCLLAALALVGMLPEPGVAHAVMGGFARVDTLGTSAALLVVLAAFVTTLLSVDWLKKSDANHPEFHALVVFCAMGMVVMVTSDHLVSIFLGLEITSIALYVLCAIVRDRAVSVESGAKYFLAGSLASGLFLMGIALFYGATGRLDLAAMPPAIGGNGLAAAGLVLLLAGFAFKLGIVPFHQWAPDVYDGAPTPVTGFMSTAVKIAGFTALFRVVMHGGAHAFAAGALAWLALATMVVGNVGALAQKSVKRMLAYSSVGHAGFLMLGPAAWAPGSDQALESAIFYLASYALTNLVAFGVLAFVETREGSGQTFEELAGLRWRNPLMAAALCVAMLSLAGIPPTAGFLAKFRLLGAVIERGQANGSAVYAWLVGVAIVSSLVSLGYYLRVIVVMYMREPRLPTAIAPRFSGVFQFTIASLTTLIVWLGFGPSVLGIGAERLFAFVQRAVGGMP
jgi:NADH-quinone oxidoreductase subunit N